MAKIYVKRRFFRNAFEAVIAARSAQADRYVSSALLRLDDETLRGHGYRRENWKAGAAEAIFFSRNAVGYLSSCIVSPIAPANVAST